MTPPDQLPAWYSQHFPAPGPQPQHDGLTLLIAYSGRIVPVITTSTALILAEPGALAFDHAEILADARRHQLNTARR
ncbi:hypothetical protein G3I57_12925 [Streptomyces albidoflavus]|uniref:hypothetical protein n=1 Tax=Streptomyces albidoflavus TaxID=1886 RepID=UPI0013DACC66|nr:hypothetical protein [Streptomyces albidoflavus]